MARQAHQASRLQLRLLTSITPALQVTTAQSLRQCTIALCQPPRTPIRRRPASSNICRLICSALLSWLSTGRCALMYFQDQQDPQIWFQDAGCSWNYLASTFTEYFRVLNMYHGIPRWQYAFTKVPMCLHPSAQPI